MAPGGTAAQLVEISSAVHTRSPSARLWAEALSSSCRTQKSGKGVTNNKQIFYYFSIRAMKVDTFCKSSSSSFNNFSRSMVRNEDGLFILNDYIGKIYCLIPYTEVESVWSHKILGENP